MSWLEDWVGMGRRVAVAGWEWGSGDAFGRQLSRGWSQGQLKSQGRTLGVVFPTFCAYLEGEIG